MSENDPSSGESAGGARSLSLVAFGGGTGMSCLLAGLRQWVDSVTAVVAVTDNGGSSGRLRKEFDMVPPGDIRNCLVALSDGEPILTKLLNYRFEESDLKGHSFGNLLITALTRVTGSFDSAVRELNRLSSQLPETRLDRRVKPRNGGLQPGKPGLDQLSLQSVRNCNKRA